MRQSGWVGGRGGGSAGKFTAEKFKPETGKLVRMTHITGRGGKFLTFFFVDIARENHDCEN